MIKIPAFYSSLLPVGLAVGSLLAGPVAAQSSAPATLTVQVNKPGAPIPKTMYGLFFEDINFGADGGLYPELVKNRSFETEDHLIGWKAIKGAAGLQEYTVLSQNPLSATNNHYLRLTAKTSSPDAGFLNEGFRGMGLKQNAEYTLSVYARRGAGSVSGLTVTLEDEKGQALAQAKLTGLTPEWKQYTAVLRPSATAQKAHLKVVLDGAGTADIDVVSVFPKDTWMKRPNGLRPDLVQLLKDMKPGFLRFPGGCIVEGRTLDQRYQWKKTVGDVKDRTTIINRWNTEYARRYTPDYYQSFGLGFFEYFQLSEDLGAEPLPILNIGMACQFNSSELAPISATTSGGPNAAADTHVHSADEVTLETFIQDALDLVEFANGPVSSPWGAKRAAMGHPAPFNLKLIGAGNEQWGPQYYERYELFAKVLKAKYPSIKLVSSAGPSPADDRFKAATLKFRELGVDLLDEHYYSKPEWFRENVRRYDDYPRNGTKIFAGEYAAHSPNNGGPKRPNNWESAISEAAFMTGLDRNADVVQMASYAPLFAHVDAWQWTPDLIWFDNLAAFGTPNYYVQKLYSLNKGTAVLPVQLPNNVKNGQDNLFTSAVADKATGEVIVKLVNYSASPRPVSIKLDGAKKLGKTGKATVLASADLQAENSLQEPQKIVPKEETFPVSGSAVSYTLAPNSFTVLRIASK
jgi:alpha-N-arabinofuranosidase